MTETEDEVRLTPPDAIPPPPPDDKETSDEDEERGTATFGLESHLQDFIAKNIESITVEGKRLKLFVDSAGRDGIEYPTSVGRIDILAVDHSGDFFVFELKRARSPDHAIGQLARYMGWVKGSVGKGRKVFGVIVAKEIGESLRYSVSVFPNASLFEYEVDFILKPANSLRENRK